jgi:hypothetical protein
MAALPRKSDPGGAASFDARARCRAGREFGGHRPRMSHFRGEAAFVSSRRRLRRLRLGAARRAAPTLGERARGSALFVLIRGIRGSRRSGHEGRNRRSLVIEEVAARVSFTVETTMLPSFALPRGVWIGRFLSGARSSREIIKSGLTQSLCNTNPVL